MKNNIILFFLLLIVTGISYADILEAENANISGDISIKDDVTASNGKYVDMKSSGSIIWTIANVTNSEEVELLIGYRLPHGNKTQNIYVNGILVESLEFDGATEVWHTKSININLISGDNTIEIRKNWGWMHFDNIELPLTHDEPNASFIITPENPIINENVIFDASTSYDTLGGSIVNYTWDFGDGSVSTGKITNHKYTNPGEYSIQLIVTDNDNKQDSTSQEVTVYTGKPIVNFFYYPQIADINEIINFDATSSFDVNGSIVSYQWNFGDGEIGSGEIISHSYSEYGIYQVTLTLTDNDGESDTKKVDIIVSQITLTINEVMSSNSLTITDVEGDYPDWIELYNGGTTVLNLENYGISDAGDADSCWLFPNVTIEPNGFLLIFASDKDSVISGELHTDFKIKSDGEMLYLFSSSGEVKDSLFTGEIATDISRGKSPDGSTNWMFFDEPTPGESNLTEGFINITSSPEFFVNNGFFSEAFSLRILSETNDADIYYTLDGSTPTRESLLYNDELTIDSTTIIRAISVKENHYNSEIVSQSYLFNVDTDLPVISLISDPVNLWDEEEGFYVFGNNYEQELPYSGANFWEDWEKPFHLEFFENDGKCKIMQDVGVKIVGNWSRARPQKPLAVFARSKYGKGSIDYQLFPDLPIDKFESFLIRNSSNDWDHTMLNDGMLQGLLDGIDIDKQAYRPCIVYLNGEYWGIHNIREKLNEHYVAAHHGVNPDNVDLMEYNYHQYPHSEVKVSNGTDEKYYEFYNYMNSHNLSNTNNYEYVKTQMDIEAFINYYVFEIYVGNTDWPGKNNKFFHPGTEDGKWRWFLFDVDHGFGLGVDMDNNAAGYYRTNAYMDNILKVVTDEEHHSWPDPDYATLFLRKLLKNLEFKTKFINRFADFMNTIFEPDFVIEKIDKSQAVIEDEMPKHFAHWKEPKDWYPLEGLNWDSVDEWYERVETMRDFARKRPGEMIKHIQSELGVIDTAEVTINVESHGSGRIKLNTIIPENYPWSGLYFKPVPVEITAIPNNGYKFSHWEGVTDSDSIVATVVVAADINITAIFISDSSENSIVINEINYNSASNFDTEDWVELYNNSAEDIDLSGWKLKDDDSTNVFDFPVETRLGAGDFLVICNDVNDFTGFFHDVSSVIGDMDFKFGNGGDEVRLYNNLGNLIDSVKFNDSLPWPLKADGAGATLELKKPEYNNAIAESWIASEDHGTPGMKNSCLLTNIESNIENHLNEFRLMQNYPNPFNPTTTINYVIPKKGMVELSLFNLLGERVQQIVQENQSAGKYSVLFDGSELSSGIYLYQLKINNNTTTRKMILMK